MFRLPLAPEGWYNMPPLKDGYMYKVYDTNMVPLTDEQKKLVEGVTPEKLHAFNSIYSLIHNNQEYFVSPMARIIPHEHWEMIAWNIAFMVTRCDE